MDERETLINDLRKLPGVGPRQAERILSFFLNAERSWSRTLISRLAGVCERVRVCEACSLRFFPQDQEESLCPMCTDPMRRSDTLVVVEKETDMRAIEASGAYRGRYFILGHAPTLEERRTVSHKGVLGLLARLRKEKSEGTMKEITLALSLTPDGEDAVSFIRDLIQKDDLLKDMKVATLGRGLSTGSELEYADKETIKNAFAGKK